MNINYFNFPHFQFEIHGLNILVQLVTIMLDISNSITADHCNSKVYENLMRNIYLELFIGGGR
jgi:hypothetical protein